MSSTRRRFAALLRGVYVALGLLPFLPAGFVAPLPLPLSWLSAWFEFQCRQAPERMGWGSAVCSRCLGIYLGLALGALLLRPRLRPGVARVWVGFASLLMLLDVATETLHLRGPQAEFRLLTGLLLSYPVAVVSVRALRNDDGPAA